MKNPLIRSLQNFARFSEEEEQELDRVASQHRFHLAPRQILAEEGERPAQLHVVLAGWACRYKELSNGKRQITSFCLPGDISDERIFLFEQMDHSIATLTPAIVSGIDPSAIERLAEDYPRIRRALARQSQIQAAIQREWILSLGQRGAPERMAHLFCEIHFRLGLVGLADRDSCDMPLTQMELGEATGLSTVHVNRVLQELRSAGLVVLRGRVLTFPCVEALRDLAMFDATYLHHHGAGHYIDAES